MSSNFVYHPRLTVSDTSSIDLTITGQLLSADVKASGITNAMLAGSIAYTKLSAMTSANFASLISDETGTGSVVFSDSPAFTTTITTPRVASTGTLNLVSSGAFGEVDFYNDATLLGGIGTTSATFNVLAQFFVTNAVTNAISESMWLAHASSGTPAAGFGTSIGAYLESSTTPGRLVGHLQWKWDVATDATRASAGDLTAYYITTERTCLSWKANSTVPMIGFLGTAPIAKPTAYTQTYATASRTMPAQTAAALTNNTGGTITTTLAAITAGAAYSQADMTAVKNALASLADQFNKLRTDHLGTTQVSNSLVDDGQAYGLLA